MSAIKYIILHISIEKALSPILFNFFGWRSERISKLTPISAINYCKINLICLFSFSPSVNPYLSNKYNLSL